MTAVLFKFKYPDGEPVVGAPFTVSLRKSSFDEENDEGILLPGDVQGLTDQAGKATLELSPGYGVYYLTMSPEGAQADVDGCVPGLRYKFIVPESDTPVRVEDLIVTVPTWSRPWDEVALAVIIEAKTASQAAATAAQASAVASFQDAERSKVSAAEALSHKNAAANSASTAATLAEQARVSAVNSGNSATAAAQSATEAANALGTKQDKHANLTALSGLVGAPNRVPYFTGLGVLSLATLNATVNDNVLGQLLRVGDHGLGTLSTPTIADMNNPMGSGFNWVTSGTTNQWVGFASGSQVLTAGASDAEVAQLSFSRSTPIRVGVRRKTTGTWQAMQEFAMYPAGQSFMPIANGGTGGATAAAARTALGIDNQLNGVAGQNLNTFVTKRDEFYVTTPINGPTGGNGYLQVIPLADGNECLQIFTAVNGNGRFFRARLSGNWGPWQEMLVKGSYGVGGVAPATTNWNTGFIDNGSSFIYGNANAVNGPGIPGYNMTGVQCMLNNGPIGMQLTVINGDNRMLFRSSYNGWLPWYEVVHTGVRDLDPAVNPAAVAYLNANANGQYVKHANGVLECWFYVAPITTFSPAANRQQINWTFPHPFVGAAPYVQASGGARLSGVISPATWQTYGQTLTAATCAIQRPDGLNIDDARDVAWYARGRWK